MTQISDPQVALKVQKAIRQAEDDLVIAIETALDNCEYIKTGDKKLEESQFNNLLRVANTTDSPEVIKNFICYQVGRDEKWGRGRNSLAARIIQDIDISLKTRANKIVADNPGADLKYIWMQLIRRYIGYGSRYLKYLNEVKGKPNLSVVDPRNSEGNRDAADAINKNGN
ncbi:hypothetical protein [Fischerella thermalis]|uniref:hypothetical protein n=1 Tax=Fischerella thermalis TaxID=372787 RepID=UPI0019DA230D|nr:hypothetical protein [Fischerella thermalis]MBF1988255.1 hypothetical protein [Fischerella thermalis M58_A2018_009]MBF2062268.1 hypothetical protein [Fischerella thermalis M66_A2018_004]MBF2070519.1 hypothetical protein [Fischerella thermalis M48_A2018_028]